MLCYLHVKSYQLVPEGFSVDGIISSNGTTGEVNDENIFKHSMSLESVKRIVSLAQQQNIRLLKNLQEQVDEFQNMNVQLLKTLYNHALLKH
jgi:hydroxymethylpyrimidine pyrophosphatase-like HAD family hydrolase